MTTEKPPPPLSVLSPLDKPLDLLTEDDISQVTREQCRQYLKRKGMRRPSWNKSQAIQQVIMLKALLESTPDSDGCSRNRNITRRQQETPTMSVQKGASAVSADDIDRSDLPGDNGFVSLGITGLTDKVKGQMAIFYSDKLASRPLCFSQEAQVDGNMGTSSLKCHLQIPNTKSSADSSVVLLPTLQTAAEGSASRKALVQRYLEKRKDSLRFKSKRKAEDPACDSSGAYISNQIQYQNKNHSNESYVFSTPPIRPPNTITDLANWE